MAKTAHCIEVRSGDGTLVLSLHFVEKEIGPASRTETTSYKKTETKQERRQSNGSSSGEGTITDAQKRFMFRILADQGIEKEGAYQFLKENFGVEILKDVSKSEASRMIEHLLGKNGGGNGDGPPF